MRRLLSFTLKAAVSTFLLYVAVDWTNIGSLGDRLSRIKLDWLAVGVAAQAMQVALGGLRWCHGACFYPPGAGAGRRIAVSLLFGLGLFIVGVAGGVT